jgi:site-specific DNA-cytosine methylase
MIIDLCAGIGRFTLDNEEVISIDSNLKTRPTICADVRELPLRPGLKPRHIHASPPCTYLSQARYRRFGYDEVKIAESLRIVAACFEAFAYLEAQDWTMVPSPSPGSSRLVPGSPGWEARSVDG